MMMAVGNVGGMVQTVNTLSNGLTAGQFAAKIFAHAMAGGIMNTLGGGKFGEGFLSAGVTQAMGMKIDQIGGGSEGFSWARTAAAAMLGGTTSVLSGGKFANGALTAAFSRAFNDEFHDADAARKAYPKKWNTFGHHWVPYASISGDGMDVSPQARTVFGLSISGEVLPNTLHNTDHSYYNVAVKDELRKWTLSKNINLSKMTAEQAGEFVNYIKNGASSNSMINGFVQKIHDFNAKVSVYNGKAGAGLAKGMMRAFFALGVADRAVQNFSTENQVCISMSWCASLTGKQ